jgi:predicted metal-dependent hydrolase
VAITPIDRPVSGAPGAPPLFLPDVPFPPYRFVPGHTPHPFAQKGGYAYGERPPAPPFLPRADWRGNEPYLRGLDFFNRGWWWEAHEAWESLWHVVEGRDAAQHALLKALIQLAASALNRERAHDRGAEDLLVTALAGLQRAALEAGGPQLMGLDLDDLARSAQHHLARPCTAVHEFWIIPV